MKVEWTTLAHADLKHIYNYIKEDNPNAATKVLAAIRNAIRGQLRTSPLSGRVGRVAGTRELVIPRLPFIVAYRVTPHNIQIIRVLHGSQQWPKSI